jgi:hypothetical protein
VKYAMMEKLIRNRKGVAEVIGTLLAVVILIFFFTNVYLWHDTATKDANQIYLEKISSAFKIEQIAGNALNITADGGSDIALSRLWIDDDATNMHYYADLHGVSIAAGASITISFDMTAGYPTSSEVQSTLKNGGFIIEYYPGNTVTCTVMNSLGVTESTILTPSQ